MAPLTGLKLFPVEEMLLELRTSILPYWMEKMTDREHGGFYGRRDGNDKLHAVAPRGIIMNTRILWTFSAAAKLYGDREYYETAGRAFNYITDHFIDKAYGGVYWMVDHLGRPLEAKKQIYAQAFAVYAFAEYFKATGKEESLQHAIDLFKLIEQYSFDNVYNGYLEAFDRQWNPLDDLRLSEKDANEKKTMNTHLHVLEAYTTLLEVWHDRSLRGQLENLVDIFRRRIINHKYQYDLFFNERWEVQSATTSFGHDIEGSWLLCEAAMVLRDEPLIEEVQQLAVQTVDRVIANGLDNDSGLMNETNGGRISDSDKHWWPQAEAMVGLVNAWEITGNDKYLEKAHAVWCFVKDKLIDQADGEWYWSVNRDGVVNREDDKAGPWKCPYHNGRTMMEIWWRLH